MKAMWIGVVLGLGAVSVGVRAEPPASQPSASGAMQAVAKVEAPDRDFGTVWAGEVISHTFKLTNAGDAPLAIKSVSTTCGCTTTKDYARIVAPGATWELGATLNTKGQSGRIIKTKQVHTDDPTQPSVPFSFKGEVRVRFKIEPMPSVQFGRIGGQSAETRRVGFAHHSGPRGGFWWAEPTLPLCTDVHLAAVYVAGHRVSGGLPAFD